MTSLRVLDRVALGLGLLDVRVGLGLVDLVADAVGGVLPRVLDLATCSLGGVLRVFTNPIESLLSSGEVAGPCPGA